MGTVDGILVDVKRVTSSGGARTERVNSAITSTIDRVDETAGRAKHSVADRVSRAPGLVQGVRAAVGTLFNGHSSRPATEARP